MTNRSIPKLVPASDVVKPHVGHGDLGDVGADAAGRFGGAGLADHLPVAGGLDDLAQAAPDDVVVIEQEDLYRGLVLVGTGLHITDDPAETAAIVGEAYRR